MLSVRFNPPQIEHEYLNGLNTCFGNWGDSKTFDWVFRRKLSFPGTDLMILKDEKQELLAGSGITYRYAELPNGNTITIGIMTGSWTLPASRRKGCFSRIIEESLRQTSERGGAMLIAFVTEDNTSTRRLIAAGSALIPGHHIFSTPETSHPKSSARFETLPPTAETISRVRERAASSQSGLVHFTYPTTEDFVSQIIERPEPTSILGDSYGNMAVVESVGDTDRIQFLAFVNEDTTNMHSFLSSLSARALGKGRKVFLYTTSREVYEVTRELGMGHKPGFITLLLADEELLQQAMGVTSKKISDDPLALANRDSDLFIGDWQIHSGDRA